MSAAGVLARPYRLTTLGLLMLITFVAFEAMAVATAMPTAVVSVSLLVVAGHAYPAGLRPRLFGASSAAWVLPALFGPLVAGLVTTHATWRLVFLGLLPLIAVGLLLVLPSLRQLPVPDGAARPAVARRWWAVLAGVGIAALQVAGQRLDLLAVPLAVAGLAALAAGLRALLPLALTEVHGYSPTAAGVPLTAGALGWSLASQVQDRRPDASRVLLLRVAFVLIAVGVAGTALAVLPALAGWPAYLSWSVAGLGLGLGMPSVAVLLLELSPGHRRGADSAALQISDVVGAALCIGLAGVLVGAASTGAMATTTAVLAALAVFTAVAVTGACVAGRAAARPPAPGPDAPARPAAPGGATTLAR